MKYVSAAWLAFGAQLHVSVLDVQPDFASAVREAVLSLSIEQRNELRVLLNSVRAAQLTDAELVQHWNAAGAEICLGAGDMRTFYDGLHEIVSVAIRDDEQ